MPQHTPATLDAQLLKAMIPLLQHKGAASVM
jgi:hypothetical protein